MRRLAAAGLALLAAGCAMNERAPVQGTSAPSWFAHRSSADELLAYLGRLRGLGDAALAAEAARQRQLMQSDADDLTRVKAAMVLSMAAPAEDAELAALVEPIARRDGGDADVKSMASFLQALAAERRRVRESSAANAVKLRDERRAAEQQKQRADALQERAAQLQQKLDALTEIEKSLSDRQVPAR